MLCPLVDKKKTIHELHIQHITKNNNRQNPGQKLAQDETRHTVIHSTARSNKNASSSSHGDECNGR